MLLKNYKMFIEDRMMTVEDWEGYSLTNNNTGSGHVIILESCVSKYIEQRRPSLSGWYCGVTSLSVTTIPVVFLFKSKTKWMYRRFLIPFIQFLKNNNFQYTRTQIIIIGIRENIFALAGSNVIWTRKST